MLKLKYFLANIFILSTEKTADKIVLAEDKIPIGFRPFQDDNNWYNALLAPRLHCINFHDC